jgi:hypothetical protein
MLIVDSLIIGGIRFVLDQVATAVEREMNDDSFLREELIAAQMRFELGEMSEEDFHSLESALLARIREIRERRMGIQEEDKADMKITGAEVTFEGEDNDHRGPGSL